MTSQTHTSGVPGEQNLPLGVLGAFSAVLAWATPAVIGKGLEMSALSIVFFRGWIGVVWAVCFLYLRGGRLTKTGFRASVWGGIALGIDLMCFFTAIKLTTIANATMIGALTPLVMLFAAPILFGERLRVPDVLAAAVAILGLAMVAYGSFGRPQWNLTGDMFAVATLFAWSVYLIFSKSAQLKVKPAEFTAWVTIVASLVATPFALFVGDGLTLPKTPLTLVALAFMAVSGWLGHVLMNWSLGHIPIWVGGSCALAVPVIATLLGGLFLGEDLVPIQGLGMLIVIAALTLVGIRSAQVAPKAKESPAAI